MRTLRFKVIDSTLTRARELLDAGEEPPFAVLAEQQTAGRGRRGHTWESPVGNLYLTLVLRPAAAATAQTTWIPLKAAVCCARAVAALVGVRLTIKWPNDLLWAGRKVGGLLCETSLTGERTGHVLVGIGLNTQATPQLPAEAAPLPGSLFAMLGVEIDHERFITEFVNCWDSLELADVALAYSDWSTGIGQPWMEYSALEAATPSPGIKNAGTGHLVEQQLPLMWRELGLGSGGELLLESLNEPSRTLTLSSVEHRCTWAYAGRGSDTWPLLVADCGNSRLKLAAFMPASAQKPQLLEVLSHDAADEHWLAALQALRASAPISSWPIFVGSVHPETTLKLQALAASVGLSVVVLPKRRLRTHGHRYALSMLGIDRLAAMEGALAQPHQGWMLVVAAGTATTIDAVRDDGWHAGGWILPGIGLALEALHGAASLLPKIEVPELATYDHKLGVDTRTAMAGGVVQMTLGAIAQACQLIRAEHGAQVEVRILLTGGNASVLLPYLGQAESWPLLILDGLREMALGGSWRA